jgi:hypothetical protein
LRNRLSTSSETTVQRTAIPMVLGHTRLYGVAPHGRGGSLEDAGTGTTARYL